MTNQFIQIFLDNFNYLNSEGQRNDWQIFCNRELIQAHEETARNLKNKLKDLIADTESNDAVKAKKFYGIVRGHFYQVEVNRAMFGLSAADAEPFSKQSDNGKTYQVIWKKPYPPANFESTLIKALEAVNKQIATEKTPTDATRAMQEHCTSLVDEIKNFAPKEKVAVRITTKNLTKRIIIMINDLIQTFLDNFNYVNSKGKHETWNFMRDKKLTHSLEQVAKSIRGDLTALQALRLSDHKKIELFSGIIRRNFNDAEECRANHGNQVKGSDQFVMKKGDVEAFKSIWMKPLPPSGFESDLIIALEAVNKKIENQLLKNDDMLALQRHCTALIDEIKNYKPKEACAVRISK
ncbi:MAG TPA: hypothetical protein VL360_06230 [Gammaproteobacteria bacterium]|jgi:hypothetical protein|nr:hypothetical protein [Gammaproteobacteria bacterium]